MTQLDWGEKVQNVIASLVIILKADIFVENFFSWFAAFFQCVLKNYKFLNILNLGANRGHKVKFLNLILPTEPKSR